MFKLDRFGCLHCLQADIIFTGECIQPVASSNNSEMKFLNNLDQSTCMAFSRKSEEIKPVITKLQVKKTCINGPDVSKVDSTIRTFYEVSQKALFQVIQVKPE